jgi:hypothetical protein
MMIGKLLLLGALLPLAFADVLQAQNHAELLAAKVRRCEDAQRVRRLYLCVPGADNDPYIADKPSRVL